MIENGNQFITIPNLCIYINATYELVFSEDEINDIIKSPKNSYFEISSNKGKLIVRLTNEREDVLRSKIKDKTIDDYIVEFETLFSISAKELIYKFLYELFSNDVGSFQKLINAKKQTTELDDYLTIISPKIYNIYLADKGNELPKIMLYLKKKFSVPLSEIKEFCSRDKILLGIGNSIIVDEYRKEIEQLGGKIETEEIDR